MKFSGIAFEFTGNTNPLYELRDRLLSEGSSICDLVRANVGEHGISFPQDILDECLLKARKLATVYKPDSLGQPLAREAVVEYYKNQLDLNPAQIVLTPGTSLAYLYCFKLLAEPGDEILCPHPSYPLMDYIAQFCQLKLNSYKLIEEAAWSIDFENLEARINARTRAIVLISPHNPSGMVASTAEVARLAELARAHNLAIISDEVFSEFLFEMDELPRPAKSNAPLVFTLNGISKSLALPGLKLAWIIVTGDEQLKRRSLAALEMISDTFLPVNEIVQFAFPEIAERGKPFVEEYRAWVKGLRNVAAETLEGKNFVLPQGGFYLTLALRPEQDEEGAAMNLLEKERILVHPGHYYDVDGNHLVFTFIQEQMELTRAMNSLRQYS